MIYFIQQGNDGPIKIGYSSGPSCRLKQLQTGNPQDLFYRGDIPGDLKNEKEIHTIFQKHRIRPDGEWFHPNEEILQYIAKYCRSGKIDRLIVESGDIKIFLAKEIELPLDEAMRLFIRFGNFRMQLLYRCEDIKRSSNGDVNQRVYLSGFIGKPQILLELFKELGLDQRAITEFNLLISA